MSVLKAAGRASRSVQFVLLRELTQSQAVCSPLSFASDTVSRDPVSGVLRLRLWGSLCLNLTILAHPWDCVQSFVVLFDPILRIGLQRHLLPQASKPVLSGAPFQASPPPFLNSPLPQTFFLFSVLPGLPFAFLIFTFSASFFRALSSISFPTLSPRRVWQDPYLLGCQRQAASLATGKQKCPWLVNLFSSKLVLHPSSIASSLSQGAVCGSLWSWVLLHTFFLEQII